MRRTAYADLELCGIHIDPLRLAAWATYVGVIHNASPPGELMNLTTNKDLGHNSRRLPTPRESSYLERPQIQLIAVHGGLREHE